MERTWIPWEEIRAELEKEPGYAKGMKEAARWFDKEVAKYGTVANPKPELLRHRPPMFAKTRRKVMNPRARALANIAPV